MNYVLGTPQTQPLYPSWVQAAVLDLLELWGKAAAQGAQTGSTDNDMIHEAIALTRWTWSSSHPYEASADLCNKRVRAVSLLWQCYRPLYGFSKDEKTDTETVKQQLRSKLNAGNRNSATIASLEASLYCVGAAILSAAQSFFHPLQRIGGTAHSQQRISLHEKWGWKYTPLHDNTHKPRCPWKT